MVIVDCKFNKLWNYLGDRLGLHVEDFILIIINDMRGYILWVASLLAKDPGPHEWKKWTDYLSVSQAWVQCHVHLLEASAAFSPYHDELSLELWYKQILSPTSCLWQGIIPQQQIKETEIVLNMYIFRTEKSCDSAIRDANSLPNITNIYVIYNNK